MNRVCVEKATGKLIEMQSGGKMNRLPRENGQFQTDADYNEYLSKCDALEAFRLDTLRKNALSAGYQDEDIEVKWVSVAEWAEIEANVREANRDLSQEVKAALAAIDLKSIRSLREWLAAQPDAPQFIKDHETAAIAERAKLPK